MTPTKGSQLRGTLTGERRGQPSRTRKRRKDRRHPQLADRTHHRSHLTVVPTSAAPACAEVAGSDDVEVGENGSNRPVAAKGDPVAPLTNVAASAIGWSGPYPNVTLRTTHTFGGVSPLDQPSLADETEGRSSIGRTTLQRTTHWLGRALGTLELHPRRRGQLASEQQPPVQRSVADDEWVGGLSRLRLVDDSRRPGLRGRRGATPDTHQARRRIQLARAAVAEHLGPMSGLPVGGSRVW